MCKQKTNTVNRITTTHSVCSKFILGYSYKMFKIYLKRKIYQEASSLITDRQIVEQPDKLPMQGIKTIKVNTNKRI